MTDKELADRVVALGVGEWEIDSILGPAYLTINDQLITRDVTEGAQQAAFKAGFQYGERHGKGLPGAWFTDYEHTYLRWKHHLNGPKPDETPEINHDNGAAQAWESTARGAASDVIAMAKTLREIAKRCEGEQDSGYGYIHGIATAALQIAGGAALTRRSRP